MDDIAIRNNLLGILVGLVPTLSKAATQALNGLLDRPKMLAAAQEAARADDDTALAPFVFEALRFDPLNPMIYRRAARDTVIAANTLRQRTIPSGTMVLAANLSAMFDRQRVASPNSFQPGRPWEHYLLWGDGLHTCFGASINRAVLPAILKPLLQKRMLRRAPGKLGRIDTGATPFPQHMHVTFQL